MTSVTTDSENEEHGRMTLRDVKRSLRGVGRILLGGRHGDLRSRVAGILSR